MNKKKILIIQTAFIGDVILATSLIEFLKRELPDSHIDFFLRKGNESLLETSPLLEKIWIWDKAHHKSLALLKLLFKIRKQKYDYTINLQRFFNSGFLTSLSGAKQTVGFHSNPLSFFFTHKIEHLIPHKLGNSFLHEVQRNALLLKPLFPLLASPKLSNLQPKLYFSAEDQDAISKLSLSESYYVLAASSVWYTKQWHHEKWKELILELQSQSQVILIGAPSDKNFTSSLMPTSHSQGTKILNLCGKLTLRQSALLMKNAKRVFVNDSAPLHLASSVNAKTTAIFCSTVPEFGYFPLSQDHKIIQLSPRLGCMPCGLHGHQSCPQGHFNCSKLIDVDDVLL